jgi:hypothetical protein
MPAGKDKEQPKAFLIVGDKGEKLPDRWYVFSYDTKHDETSITYSSQGNKMELVKYKADTELETLICTKCKKEIGKKDFYRSEEDKEFYHRGCVE